MEKTLQGEFAQSSSGFERSKAALCLLVLGYDFPEDFAFSRLPNPLFPELDIILTRQCLPDEYLGTWWFSKSSGGIHGQGDLHYAVERLTLLPDNTMREYQTGKPVRCTTFSPRYGGSIFSQDPVWLIQLQGVPFVKALWIGASGSLVIADNVFDGYVYAYTRDK